VRNKPSNNACHGEYGFADDEAREFISCEALNRMLINAIERTDQLRKKNPKGFLSAIRPIFNKSTLH